MRTYDRYDTFGSVLDNPVAREVLERRVPDLLSSSMATQLADFPLGPFLEFAIAPDASRAAAVLAELATIPNPSVEPVDAPTAPPRDDYEPASVTPASAGVTLPSEARQNTMVEVRLFGPSHGNPFIDVDLQADFTGPAGAVTVGGFYDGDGTYGIRFLPSQPGTWSFITRSNARSLDGLTGTIDVVASDAKGPVRVIDQFAFAYADGSPYVPLGTTAYAWTHQPAELQEQTLATLAEAPFTKIRMGLFPKDFLFNANEPDEFVFPLTGDGFDHERFDVGYFAHLEQRIRQLDELGIQADLILFHPYDRWGFSTLSESADVRYLTYVVRRLAAFPNVWWSMANEYELLTTKRPDRWHRLAETVQREDHVGHLLSIHNWSELFDYSAPWTTHASLQRGDREIGKKVDEWRLTWGKPVVIDEYGYEGDIDQGWGNHTAEAVVAFAWAAMIRGGYISHGETFVDDTDVLWWSKGGVLKGQSAARLGFLRRIVEESPTGRLDPLPSDWDVAWGGVPDEYIVLYFGSAQPRFRSISVPQGMRASIEVIDTWNMTITAVPGVHEGVVRVDLPARPYMAIRLRRAELD